MSRQKTSALYLLLVFTMLILSNDFLMSKSDYKPISFIRDSLPNDLVVIYNLDKSAPIVTTVMHYKVGSKDENPNLTGFAHFFEHLMFEATPQIGRGELDKMIQSAGGNLNAHTSFDETVYHFNLPSNQLPLALWIESQRLRSLIVDSIGVETQRRVVQEERKQRVENRPYGSAFDIITENMFPKGSYSWTPIGSEEHINNASINEFRKFYDKFYQPSNATLVISGDFDIETARKYIDTYFLPIPNNDVSDREKFVLGNINGEIRKEIPDKLAQLPAVFIAYQAPSMTDSLYYASNLLSSILSDGESSRIYRKLINESEEAVNADLSYIPLEKSGILLFTGIAGIDKSIKKVEKLFYGEVEKIIEKGISDEELSKAKNIFEANFIKSKKSTFSKAQDLASFQSYYGEPDLINSELEKYMSVTKQEILTVAKKYLDTKNRVVLIYQPEKVN